MMGYASRTGDGGERGVPGRYGRTSGTASEGNTSIRNLSRIIELNEYERRIKKKTDRVK